MTVLLEVEGLGRRFGPLAALSEVSLTVDAGGRHAVIGPNGAGKTTLLNLVAGALPASAGRIRFDGRDITGLSVVDRARLGIGRTWQHPATFDRLPVAANLALAHHRARCAHHPRRWAASERPTDCVHRAAVDAGLADQLSTVAGALPYGARRRLEVAMVLAARPRLLLLDEPTAGLTAADIDILAQTLRGLPASTALLVVDHHIDFVAAVADTVTVLHHGSHLITGTPGQVRADPQVRRVYLATDTTTNTDNATDTATATGIGGPAVTRPRRQTTTSDGDAPILRVAGLCAGHHEAAVLDRVDLQVAAGQVVAVVGRSGAGKTTLLDTIAGLHPARAGQISIGGTPVTDADPRRRHQHGISLVPQGRRLFAALTVAEHLAIPRQPRPAARADVDRMLTLFPALAARRRHRPRQLSGGEQQMLAMARAVAGRPRVLLLDEPSEGLAPAVIDDLAGIITDLAARHAVAVLLAEQNLPLALRVAGQLCVLHEGRIVRRMTPEAVAGDPHLLDRYLGAGPVTGRPTP